MSQPEIDMVLQLVSLGSLVVGVIVLFFYFEGQQ